VVEETMTDVKGVGKDQESMPDPESGAKPDSPSDLDKRSWKYVARKTLREFSDDECTDQAAALTYYAVLAVFPAMLALFSLLGVVGRAPQAVSAVKDIMKPLVSADTLKTFDPILESGYVGAFGRAMNRIYEIDEGRPFWKLRPLMLVITLAAVLLSALVLVMLIVSGGLAQSIGDTIGLGRTAVTIWNIVKWPIIGLVVMVVVALLYYATPNVKQPKFKWISVGAAIAIVIWVLASIAFAFYVGNFSSYNKTYGTMAGVIVTLLWLWITNLALLLGAEIDSELERGRELEAGIPAEGELQLPARDTRNIEKAREKEQKDIELGRAIREQADPQGEVAAKYADSPTEPSPGRK
jgi:membrane protein